MQVLQRGDPPGVQRPDPVRAALFRDPVPQRMSRTAVPVLRTHKGVRHAQPAAAGLAQPPCGCLDATAPVGAFGVDDPQSDWIEDDRVAFLAEPQYSRCRGPDRRNEDLLLAVLTASVLRHVLATVAVVLEPPTAAAQTGIGKRLDTDQTTDQTMGDETLEFEAGRVTAEEIAR
ncbi:hypothetical protein ACIPM2_35120 [Streptomyces sp. NPDC086081]|uniref:hypothetical protein n=1 Tax=Streptomyces sp. NPDC086081 TaxID=3365749 RepID=UPI003818386E